MVKIMFVCYGNICRSPMAEFLFKEMLRQNGEEGDFIVSSSATSNEELNHQVHYGTRNILNRLGIDCSNKRAVKLTKTDYDNFDYFIGMEEMNRRDMLRIFGGDKYKKVYILPDFSSAVKDIADPYWTGDFNRTFNDITCCLKDFYKFLKNK